MARRRTIVQHGLAAAIFGIAIGTHAVQHDGKAHALLHQRQDVASSITNLLGGSSAPVDDPSSPALSEVTVSVVPMASDGGAALPTVGPSSLSPGLPLPSGGGGSTAAAQPVATVCPNQSAGGLGSGLFTLLPLPLLPSLDIINATAPLPNGSSTVFSSGATSLPIISSSSSAAAAPAAPAAPAPASAPPTDPANAAQAQILVDAAGCQTLFLPPNANVNTSTTVTAGGCSTVLSPLGIPPVTVSDCAQWVTFSSDVPPSSVPSSAAGETAVLLQVAAPQPSPPTAGVAGIMSSPPLSAGAGAVAEGRYTYYAIHWQDVGKGGVPSSVRAVECSSGGDDGVVVGGGAQVGVGVGGCQTFEERWSVSTFIDTVVETGSVVWDGPVTVTDPALQTTYTTTLRVSGPTTHTREVAVERVVKLRVDAGVSSSSSSSAIASAIAIETSNVVSRVRATKTITETAYMGVETAAVAGDGGIRTVELLPVASAAAAA